MNLEKECASKTSQRLFELFFSLITGSVGVFFVVIFTWLLNAAIRNHKLAGSSIAFLSILFLIAYWFLKLTYKLALNKCTYLLSVTELKITGWSFILLPPCGAILYLINGQGVDLLKYIGPTLPACLYGYYALKAAKNRKAASNQEDAPDLEPVR